MSCRQIVLGQPKQLPYHQLEFKSDLKPASLRTHQPKSSKAIGLTPLTPKLLNSRYRISNLVNC